MSVSLILSIALIASAWRIISALRIASVSLVASALSMASITGLVDVGVLVEPFDRRLGELHFLDRHLNDLRSLGWLHINIQSNVFQETDCTNISKNNSNECVFWRIDKTIQMNYNKPGTEV